MAKAISLLFLWGKIYDMCFGIVVVCGCVVIEVTSPSRPRIKSGITSNRQ